MADSSLTGETCGDTTSEGYVCTLLKGHLGQHYDHEHHHWPLAPPAAGETVEDIECEDREFLAALGATGETPSDQPHLSGSNNIGPLQHPAHGWSCSCPLCVPLKYITASAPVWKFTADELKFLAHDVKVNYYTTKAETDELSSALREAAALRREVERLTGEVEIAEQAERHWWEEVRATRALLQAAEREVERLTNEKNQSSSDPRREQSPIIGQTLRRIEGSEP